MKLLLRAHKLLLAFALGLAILLVPWGIWQHRQTGEASALVLAGGAAAVALAVVIYYRRVVRRYARR